MTGLSTQKTHNIGIPSSKESSSSLKVLHQGFG